MDKTVAGKIAAKWTKKGLFDTYEENLIAGWCIDFYNEHQAAPKKLIESVFEEWSKTTLDKDKVRQVERILEGLSGEYSRLAKESNSGYIIKLATNVFNKVQYKQLKDLIDGGLETGDLKRVKKALSNLHDIDVVGEDGIDLFRDKASFMEAFESRQKPIVKYPGALGELLNKAFTRDAFVSFQSPEKRGKSFVLIDLAYRALMQNRKVAFFSVGDMTKNQVTVRFASRAAKRPFDAGKYKYPTEILHDPDSDVAVVSFEDKELAEPMTRAEAWRIFRNVGRKHDRADNFKMVCSAAGTMGLAGIKSILHSWERKGFVPDVLIIDYADILAPPFGIVDSREQINANWIGLRGLGSSMNCLVLTATQAKASSYTAETMDMTHFSNDKRKLAHVTAMIALDQTPEEKALDVLRMGFIALREGEYNPRQRVHVAGCRSICNMVIHSAW